LFFCQPCLAELKHFQPPQRFFTLYSQLFLHRQQTHFQTGQRFLLFPLQQLRFEMKAEQL